ncbi:PhzF family phenazine biosynthesis isomerase, partial [Dysgonomonas sp. OttesenSCG-928-M03]|nr:PhzF family phenazine biosynthesis isomerase [Dysgonomonas sp. OttesenSCG-928-M03]
QQYRQLRIHTNRGILNVENRIKEEDAVFIEAPLPFEKTQIPEIRDIAENLQIDINEINQDLPVSIINAGLTTLLIPIKNKESVLSISPDLNTLKDFCIKSDIDIIEVFTDDVYDKDSCFRTRVFAPVFGYLEDPATGSGNSALGYYLLKNDLWNSDTIIIEQNSSKDAYNIVKLRKQSKEETIRVFFGGGAITRIDGQYII